MWCINYGVDQFHKSESVSFDSYRAALAAYEQIDRNEYRAGNLVRLHFEGPRGFQFCRRVEVKRHYGIGGDV